MRVVARIPPGAGEREWVWNGRNDAGSLLPAGIYWARLAGADEEDPTAREIVEHLLGQRGGNRGDGGRVLADRRLRPHALAAPQRLSEEACQDRARGADPVRRADLAEDLGLARHHRVEPCRHTEEVERRVFAV